MAQQIQQPVEQVKRDAARSAPWTLMTFATRRGVIFLSTLVLARLLTPADFGVIALASTVIIALSVLRDLGLGNTIIVRQDLDARAQGTVLTLMLATAVLVAVLMAALAPAFAAFFRESRLTTVLIALTPAVCIGGITGFYDVVLQRELKFKDRFWVAGLEGGVYTATAVVLAASGLGIWSMVIGQVVSVAAGAALLVVLAGSFRVRPTYDGAVARDVVVSGRAFLGLGALDVLQQNTDYVAIGRFLSTTQLSFYYTAYRLAALPGTAIADPISRVTFAGFSRMRAEGHDVGPSFLSVLRLVALASCPMGVILSGVADPFVRAAFGDQWLPMIATLSIMGLWAALRAIEITVGWLLHTMGHAGLGVRIGVGSYAVLLPTLVSAAAFGGIVAVAWVMVAYNAVRILVLGFFVWRRLGLAPTRQWRAVQPVLLACVPAWVAARLVAGQLDSPFLGLPAASLAGLAAYLVALTALDRAIVPWSVGQVRKTLGRA